MAIQVPTYTSQRTMPGATNALPSVRQTAAPDASMLGGNFSAPVDRIGEGLQSLGKETDTIYRKMQDVEDSDVIMRAETQLRESVIAKQTEWSDRRGVQAWGVTKDAASWWDSEGSKFAEGLSPRQRQLFDQTAGKIRLQTLDGASKHEAAERRASATESNKAAVVSAVNFAVANADNPEAVTGARNDILKRTQLRASLEGWSPERVEVEVTDVLTTMHGQVALGLVDRSPEAAEAYIQQYAHEIDPIKLQKLREGVGDAVRLGKVQSFADTALGAGMPENEAIASARKEFHGKDEAEAVREVQSRYREQDQARQRMQREAAEAAFAQVLQTGRVSNSALMAMDPKDALSLRNHLQAQADRAAARASNDPARKAAAEADDRATFWTLVDMADTEPEAFANVNLTDAAKGLGNAEFNKLREAQRAIRAGQNPDTKEGEQRVAAHLKKHFRGLGIEGQSKAAIAERAKLLEAIDNERVAEEKRLGRPLTTKELTAISDDQVIAGTRDGFLWMRPETRKYKAGPGDDFKPLVVESNGATAPAKGPTIAGRVSPAKITNDAEYRALKSGTRFTGPDGKERIKP